MRASLRELARKCNHLQIFVVSSARAVVLAFAICAIVFYRSSSCAAQTVPAKSESTQTPTSLAVPGASWTGDFDEMLKRRHIRVLVASSKTQYYSAYKLISEREQ